MSGKQKRLKIPREKFKSARITPLYSVYREWLAKNFSTAQPKLPPFRFAIGVSPLTVPKGKVLEEVRKEDQEKWGALWDAIVLFAKDTRDDIAKQMQPVSADADTLDVKAEQKEGPTGKINIPMQPLEITIITAYGRLGAIQKQAEAALLGNELKEDEALKQSIIDGEKWKKDYYLPLLRTFFTKEMMLKEFQLNMDIKISLQHWTEIEKEQGYAQDLSTVKRWYKEDSTYEAEVNKSRNEFVNRALARYDIKAPIDQSSHEYSKYFARKRNFENFTTQYILTEAPPLTVGLANGGIAAILYPSGNLKDPGPAALLATFDKCYTAQPPLCDSSRLLGKWCSYEVKPITNGDFEKMKISCAFHNGTLLPESPPSPIESPISSSLASDAILFRSKKPARHIRHKSAPSKWDRQSGEDATITSRETPADLDIREKAELRMEIQKLTIAMQQQMEAMKQQQQIEAAKQQQQIEAMKQQFGMILNFFSQTQQLQQPLQMQQPFKQLQTPALCMQQLQPMMLSNLFGTQKQPSAGIEGESSEPEKQHVCHGSPRFLLPPNPSTSGSFPQ